MLAWHVDPGMARDDELEVLDAGAGAISAASLSRRAGISWTTTTTKLREIPAEVVVEKSNADFLRVLHSFA